MGYLFFRAKAKKNRAINLEQKFEENISSRSSVDKKRDKYQDEADALLESQAIGVIRIDKINVVLPVYGNTTEEALLDGAGVVEDTNPPTSEKNTVSVLAGHRGGRNEKESFLNIHKLENGDEIKITTKDQILYYKVVGEEIIEPTDWSKFTKEKEKTKLFLVSCHPYPYNYQRLLIEAELVENVDKDV